MTNDTPTDNSRQLDRDDLNREIIGDETGRMKRFRPAVSGDGIHTDEQKRSKDALLAVLLDELASPEDVNALMASVGNLQDRLDHAFADLEADTDALDARTVRLDDGRAVFRMEDGRFRTIAGDVIDQRDLPDNLTDDSATWEEYQALLARRAQLSGIQTDVVDVINERAAKGDMTVREVQEFERILETANRELDGESPSLEAVEQDATAPVPPPVSSIGQSPAF